MKRNTPTIVKIYVDRESKTLVGEGVWGHYYGDADTPYLAWVLKDKYKDYLPLLTKDDCYKEIFRLGPRFLWQQKDLYLDDRDGMVYGIMDSITLRFFPQIIKFLNISQIKDAIHLIENERINGYKINMMLSVNGQNVTLLSYFKKVYLEKKLKE